MLGQYLVLVTLSCDVQLLVVSKTIRIDDTYITYYSLVGTYKPYPIVFHLHLGEFVLVPTRIWWWLSVVISMETNPKYRKQCSIYPLHNRYTTVHTKLTLHIFRGPLSRGMLSVMVFCHGHALDNCAQ